MKIFLFFNLPVKNRVGALCYNQEMETQFYTEGLSSVAQRSQDDLTRDLCHIGIYLNQESN